MNCSGRVIQVLFSFLITLSLVLCEFKLLVLHTNDMHARFEETNAHSGKCIQGRCYGGLARLKAAAGRLRQEARERGYSSIFLNAGDTYQGSVYYTMFKWKIVSELLNMMDIDVMSLGNHELDDGPEGLAPLIANSSLPIVCCNLDFSGEPVFRGNPNLTKLMHSKVLDVDGVKVGVIGYLTPETKFIAKVGGITLLDEITELKKEVVRLKQEGVKILIALGHSGYTTDKLIAAKVPDLDLVVGGHTNTFLYTGKAPDLEVPEGAYPTVVTQPSGHRVLVVQAYAFTKYLGHLELTFNDEGNVVRSSGNPILLDDSFGKDIDVERTVLKYGSQIKDLVGRKIGFSRAFLEGDAHACRIRECNFGNFVSDALVDANAKDFYGKGWSDAPIALVQGGGLRTSIDTKEREGVITYEDLLTVLPYQNSVERLTLTGTTLKQVLEHSVSRYSKEERLGAFMQYSGIRVKYDLTKPPHERVVSALVRCGNCTVPQYYPLKLDKEYVVLTSSFLADGGDDYKMLKNAKERKTLSFSDLDAVETYLTRVSPIYPEINGRIQFVDVALSKPSSSSSLSGGPCLLMFSVLTALIVTKTRFSHLLS